MRSPFLRSCIQQFVHQISLDCGLFIRNVFSTAQPLPRYSRTLRQIPRSLISLVLAASLWDMKIYPRLKGCRLNVSHFQRKSQNSCHCSSFPLNFRTSSFGSLTLTVLEFAELKVAPFSTTFWFKGPEGHQLIFWLLLNPGCSTVSFSSIAASLWSTSAFNLAALSISAVMSSSVDFSSAMSSA